MGRFPGRGLEVREKYPSGCRLQVVGKATAAMWAMDGT
jgi:hypothetical protein